MSSLTELQHIALEMLESPEARSDPQLAIAMNWRNMPRAVWDYALWDYTNMRYGPTLKVWFWRRRIPLNFGDQCYRIHLRLAFHRNWELMVGAPWWQFWILRFGVDLIPAWSDEPTVVAEHKRTLQWLKNHDNARQREDSYHTSTAQ